MPAMAIPASAENGEQAVTALLHDAQRLYDLGCAAIRSDSYEEAVDCFSKALEIRVQHYGELAPECASTYYKYGCALLYKVQTESDPLGDTKVEPLSVTRASKEQPLQTSAAEGSKESIYEEYEDDPDVNTEGEGGEEEEDEAAGDEEEGDLELAWKMLDIARVIHAKGPVRTLAEVDVIIALGDLSLEKEDFQNCYEDYEKAMVTLEGLVEQDNRRIAELCYKLALAKQFDLKPQEALEYCKRAVSVCEKRHERLTKELVSQRMSEGEPNRNASEDEKKARGKEIDESGGDTVESGAPKDGILVLDAEIKEIEESLVDLREKVEELQQMVTAPSLLDSLQATNPEAAAVMKQAFSMIMQGGSGVGTSSNCGSNAELLGSSSSAEPVTNLGVVGRGIKRATPTAVAEEQLLPPDIQPAKRTAEDLLNGAGLGETQIGFGGSS